PASWSGGEPHAGGQGDGTRRSRARRGGGGCGSELYDRQNAGLLAQQLDLLLEPLELGPEQEARIEALRGPAERGGQRAVGEGDGVRGCRTDTAGPASRGDATPTGSGRRITPGGEASKPGAGPQDSLDHRTLLRRLDVSGHRSSSIRIIWAPAYTHVRARSSSNVDLRVRAGTSLLTLWSRLLYAGCDLLVILCLAGMEVVPTGLRGRPGVFPHEHGPLLDNPVVRGPATAR